MTYRAVVRHVRYWRGTIHHWSTVYQFVGVATTTPDVTAAQTVLTADRKMCFGTQTAAGGAYECQIYNQASGGIPIATYTAFDPTSPANWTGFIGSVWAGGGANQPTEPAEAALLVEWAAGFSKSGKRVVLRKWYHSVPPIGMSASTDVNTTDGAALLAQANAITGCIGSYGLTLGSSTGRLAGAATVERFYANHQMARGRRRKPLVTASGKYTGPLPKLFESGEVAGGADVPA